MDKTNWTRASTVPLSWQKRCASPLNVGLISTSRWGWIQIKSIWSIKSLMTAIKLPQQWTWVSLWTSAAKITNNETFIRDLIFQRSLFKSYIYALYLMSASFENSTCVKLIYLLINIFSVYLLIWSDKILLFKV